MNFGYRSKGSDNKLDKTIDSKIKHTQKTTYRPSRHRTKKDTQMSDIDDPCDISSEMKYCNTFFVLIHNSSDIEDNIEKYESKSIVDRIESHGIEQYIQCDNDDRSRHIIYIMFNQAMYIIIVP